MLQYLSLDIAHPQNQTSIVLVPHHPLLAVVEELDSIDLRLQAAAQLIQRFAQFDSERADCEQGMFYFAEPISFQLHEKLTWKGQAEALIELECSFGEKAIFPHITAAPRPLKRKLRSLFSREFKSNSKDWLTFLAQILQRLRSDLIDVRNLFYDEYIEQLALTEKGLWKVAPGIFANEDCSCVFKNEKPIHILTPKGCATPNGQKFIKALCKAAKNETWLVDGEALVKKIYGEGITYSGLGKILHSDVLDQLVEKVGAEGQRNSKKGRDKKKLYKLKAS